MKKLIFLMLLAFPVFGLTVSWDASVSPDVTGYRLHWGAESRNYTSSIDVGNVLQYKLDNELDVNQLIYIAATAYDQAGNESSYSSEVFWQGGALDSIWYYDSQIFVQVNTPLAGSWTLKIKIDDYEFILTSDGDFGSHLHPVINDWTVCEYDFTLYNSSGETAYTRSGTIEIPATGDYDNDGEIRIYDFIEFDRSYRNPDRYRNSFDFNRDGRINLTDFVEFAKRYGKEKSE